MEASMLARERIGTRWHWSLILLLCLFSGIALYNARVYPAAIGYDAHGGHLSYAETLSKLRLPSPSESREYFSPPLAYVLPAALMALHVPPAIRLSQLAQVLLSLGIMVYLLKFSELIRPSDLRFKILALTLCGTLPVYYKTFCQIRGEPYVAFLCLFVLYEGAKAFDRGTFSLRHSAVLGIACGLLILARQWGVLVLLGATLFSLAVAIRRAEIRVPLAKTATVAFVIAFAVGGWFYLLNIVRYSTLRAFPRPATAFAFTNQPLDFYAGTGNGMLFRDPVRQAFPNQLWPIFYSETWGDYWCYFVVYGRDSSNGESVFQTRPPSVSPSPIEGSNGWFVRGDQIEASLRGAGPVIETNRYSIAPYLGRVNLVSMVPTLVLVAGLALGTLALFRCVTTGALDRRPVLLGLLAAVTLASGLGYGWFLISYPSLGKGDTIKATYMLHTFPLLALLGSEALLSLRERSGTAFRAAVCALALVALHNSGALFARAGAPFGTRVGSPRYTATLPTA